VGLKPAPRSNPYDLAEQTNSASFIIRTFLALLRRRVGFTLILCCVIEALAQGIIPVVTSVKGKRRLELMRWG
jgi:hypothetical protein